MSWIQALLLGLLQGATEFLPVSSSGHLVLVPWLLGWPAPTLAFDTLVHWGTAAAVVGYFWRDWLGLIEGAWEALRSRSLDDPRARLLLWLVIGTLPAALVGWALEDFFEGMFGQPAAAAGFLLVTASILTLVESGSRRDRSPAQMTWLDALLVGLAQAAAILPGISRSGSTIAAGMARGQERQHAARFSFLLSTPIILGAGLLQVADLVGSGGLPAQLSLLLVGFLAALLAGLACIHFLLRYLQRRSLYPFAIYCALVGLGGLVLALVRG